ncbi:hypothetical protein F6X54_30800 [Micromonospora aurantiaca]|uniref:Uncharacterized protein n=1 Tax=Micromonospora aurantiaca (nom. illeg.) TaxID=47850 RepID=A0ABQ6U8G7_9ACTN|nr:hypothetical protein F6X54_30800 [Micromonospora aurantiaca]
MVIRRAATIEPLSAVVGLRNRCSSLINLSQLGSRPSRRPAGATLTAHRRPRPSPSRRPGTGPSRPATRRRRRRRRPARLPAPRRSRAAARP